MITVPISTDFPGMEGWTVNATFEPASDGRLVVVALHVYALPEIPIIASRLRHLPLAKAESEANWRATDVWLSLDPSDSQTKSVNEADSDLMTIGQVAEAFQLSRVTVRRMIARGDLPAHRVGPRAIRIRRGDVESAMSQVPTKRGA